MWGPSPQHHEGTANAAQACCLQSLARKDCQRIRVDINLPLVTHTHKDTYFLQTYIHYITLRDITHYVTLHYINLHYIKSHYIELHKCPHYIELHKFPLHYITCP